MDEASKSLKVTQLFTRARHDSLSGICLTQNFFHKNQRALSQNSDYNSQFITIARQVTSG